MESNSIFKVGDYVFLFFNKTGTIYSARVLEKTIRETISDGPKTEFILEAYSPEGDSVVNKRIKFSEEKCKMFSSLDELKVELHEHVLQVINTMIKDCQETFIKVSKSEVREN